MKTLVTICILASLLCGRAGAEPAREAASLSAAAPDAPRKEKKTEVDAGGRRIKTGWNFGVLPSIAFDADKGFQYGVLTNIYDYGDGSLYPGYRHSLYAEASWTTKNNGNFRLYYNSRHLIPDHWVAFDISYLPDTMMDFFGFNGGQSVFNHEWNDSKGGGDQYLTRAFYKRRSNLFRTSADISGTITGSLKWNAGAGVLGFMNGDVNLSRAGLPEDQTELYKLYKEWGLISREEDKGGWHPYLRAGLSYDSRNAVTNPARGIFADAFVTYSAAFGDLKDYNYAALNVDFRHYVTIVNDRLTLAYRICSQNVIAGRAPYYADNYLNVLELTRNIFDALGGKNTFRGVMRNRILADGFLYGTVELRSRLWFFDIGRQHFYLGLVPFLDAGMVTQPRKVDEAAVRASFDANKDIPGTQTYIVTHPASSSPRASVKTINDFFDFNRNIYAPHFSAGLGLRVAMNENFVLSVDWAAPFDRQDNNKMANIYIGVGYLF